MRRVFPALTVACCTLLFASGSASAQAAGFALDRFEPADRGSNWFVLDSLDLRGHGRLALGVTGELGYRPLAIYDADGSLRSAIVEHQLFAHPGGSFVLWDRLRVSASLPVGLYATGDGGTIGGVVYPAPSSAQTVGDLRFGADARVIGQSGDPFQLAFGLHLFAPTGSRGAYSGDETFRATPRALVAGDLGVFAYSAKLGIAYRGHDVELAGSPLGSELVYGAAVGVRALDRRLLLGPELYGSSVVTADLFKTRTTPADLLFGAHLDVGAVRIGAGAGFGVSRGYGSPAARAVLSIEWLAPVQRDRDGDGIVDEADACVDVPGVASPDAGRNGCPPPRPPPAPLPAPEPDTDGDGVLDKEDACVDVPGKSTGDPATHGCPDTDGDGIFDRQDACPTDPGVASADPAQNGCPDPDRDKDGIPNSEDACPDAPGPRAPDPQRNGCPAARIEGKQIKILEQVKFATGSDRILPDSDSILSAVKKILEDHPEIAKLSIEGHTDSRGGEAANQKLSERRAASVVRWLVQRGIAKERLDSQGFGQTRPIDSNATDEGRRNNRRVEFHIRGGSDPTRVEEPQNP